MKREGVSWNPSTAALLPREVFSSRVSLGHSRRAEDGCSQGCERDPEPCEAKEHWLLRMLGLRVDFIGSCNMGTRAKGDNLICRSLRFTSKSQLPSQSSPSPTLIGRAILIFRQELQ